MSDWVSLDYWHKLEMDLYARIGLRGVVKKLDNWGWRPNQMTGVSVWLGLWGWWWWGTDQRLTVILIGAHFILDMFDGYMARVNGRTTRWGEVLDHGGDYMIGALFLLKAWWRWQNGVFLVTLLLSILELSFLMKKKLLADKMPSRMFLLFFLGEWYWQGIIVQLIYEPISLWVFLKLRRKSVKSGESDLNLVSESGLG